MIQRQQVQELVDQWLAGKDYFLTDLTISTDDRIVVEIDHAEGVWIEDCVELSRFIEAGLDREEADFELEVGSAGLGQPFKVLRQYEIHLGDTVEVLATTGEKFIGQLTAVTPEQVEITAPRKVKAAGEKRPHWEEVVTTIPFEQLKWTRLHIDFK